MRGEEIRIALLRCNTLTGRQVQPPRYVMGHRINVKNAEPYPCSGPSGRSPSPEEPDAYVPTCSH